MRNEELNRRTKDLALRVIRLFKKLPNTEEARIIGRQALRSATGVAANYREASRARSDAELCSKLGIVEQELDETILWLELLVEAEIVPQRLLTELQAETEELLKITVASIRTVKARKK